MRKCKMGNVMLEIFDVFLRNELWCTGIKIFGFCKWLRILNWSKCILVVGIATQILLTMLLSIDYSSRCKFRDYIQTHTQENHAPEIDKFRKKR